MSMFTVHLIEARADGTVAAGTRHDVEARPGQSLMQAAVRAGIEGIAADCGGSMTCATCHVYVTDAWQARLPAATAEEQEMLAFAAAEHRPGSRLACQITLQPDLAGLTVCLPVRQY